jgi:DDE superfamily endonuclease
MTSSHPLPDPCQWFPRLASALDRRSAPRLALLFLGAVLARGRRTVTGWIRAAGLSDQFRTCYAAVAAAGTKAESIAAVLMIAVVKPLVSGDGRLTLALDDTPTRRYGPQVQGAGVHHSPTAGPAGSAYVFGHVWVVLGLLAPHWAWGVIALPLLLPRRVGRSCGRPGRRGPRASRGTHDVWEPRQGESPARQATSNSLSRKRPVPIVSRLGSDNPCRPAR